METLSVPIAPLRVSPFRGHPSDFSLGALRPPDVPTPANTTSARAPSPQGELPAGAPLPAGGTSARAPSPRRAVASSGLRRGLGAWSRAFPAGPAGCSGAEAAAAACGGGFFGGGDLYPWLNNSNQINDGFQNQLLNDNISGIRSDLGDISTQLCNGFNQTQLGMLQAVNGLQSQLAQCCCDNRLATVETQNVVASEGAATRLAIQNQTQSILDKLCALELDGYKREADSLRSQLTAANLAASQARQTAEIQTNIVNELRSCPIPSQPVYGSQPIFTCGCGNNGGCGCGG